MRIDVTKTEFEVIVDALKGQSLRCTAKVREQLAQRLDWQLHPSKAPDSNGWAPMKPVSIRSSMPSGIFKRKGESHWSYSKPKTKKAKQSKAPRVPQTADDILAEL